MQLDYSPFDTTVFKSDKPTADDLDKRYPGSPRQTFDKMITMRNRNPGRPDSPKRFAKTFPGALNKIAFPSTADMQKTRPRSWHEVISETKFGTLLDKKFESDRSFNRSRRDALDQLDGLSGMEGREEELFRYAVGRRLDTTGFSSIVHVELPRTPPRHDLDVITHDQTPRQQVLATNVRASAGSLSPLGTVLLTPATGVNITPATIEAEHSSSGISNSTDATPDARNGEALTSTESHQVRIVDLSGKSLDHHKTRSPDTLDDSERDLLLDFTRFQRPVARMIEYQPAVSMSDSPRKALASQAVLNDPFRQPSSGTYGISPLLDTSLAGGQATPRRFITPSHCPSAASSLALPVAMIPIKDIEDVARPQDRSPSLAGAALRNRGSRILLKAKPSIERLSRAFEEGFSKTLAVLGGGKQAPGKISLMADIEAYRGADQGSATTTKQESHQSLARSFSSAMLNRHLKRDSVDSGFSWSPKFWLRTIDTLASNTLGSSPSTSPRPIRRRPRWPSFGLSSLPHFKLKKSVETGDSAPSSDYKRSDSEESWGNTRSEQAQAESEKQGNSVMASRKCKQSRSGTSHGICRTSILRFLKHGSAWGAMKHISRKRQAQQNHTNSLSASSISDSMSQSSGLTNYELLYDVGDNHLAKQDARDEALAILEGRAGSGTRMIGGSLR